MLALANEPGSGGAMMPVRVATVSREASFRSLFEEHYEFIWRQLRRLGVHEDQVDDAAQEVFIVAARRLGDIREGAERAFLFGIARRVASDVRRSRQTRTGLLSVPLARDAADPAPSPEQDVQRHRTQALLDAALDDMNDETREVFILFELEELSRSQIAQLLGLPEGTVASRLRRAREEFSAIVNRAQCKLEVGGGSP